MKNKYFIIFVALIGIVFTLGFATVDNNEPLINQDSSVLPSVDAPLPIQLQPQTISVLNISGNIITWHKYEWRAGFGFEDK